MEGSHMSSRSIHLERLYEKRLKSRAKFGIYMNYEEETPLDRSVMCSGARMDGGSGSVRARELFVNPVTAQWGVADWSRHVPYQHDRRCPVRFKSCVCTQYKPTATPPIVDDRFSSCSLAACTTGLYI